MRIAGNTALGSETINSVTDISKAEAIASADSYDVNPELSATSWSTSTLVRAAGCPCQDRTKADQGRLGFAPVEMQVEWQPYEVEYHVSQNC